MAPGRPIDKGKEPGMGTSELFDHTADVGLRVRAGDLDDLFRTAAEGLMDAIVANRDHVRPTEAEDVELEAETQADLLASWLNEIIFRTETGHRLYRRFDVRVEANRLRATLHGESIDRERHILDHEVKAATHHGLMLEEQAGGGWVAEVILDI
jgi:SHS2 domain-containing protein